VRRLGGCGLLIAGVQDEAEQAGREADDAANEERALDADPVGVQG